MPRSAQAKLGRWLAAAIMLALLVWLAERVNWAQVGAAVARAWWPGVLLAACVNFVVIAAKTARWRTMLLPSGQVAYRRLYYYLIVSYAASALLPARAGEALRVYLLRRRDGIPVADSVGIAVVEKLFEVLGLLTVVLPLPLLLPLPRSAQVTIGIVAVGGLVLLLVAVLLARRLGRSPGSRFAALAQGLACMRSPSNVALAVAFSIASYVLDGCMIWICLRALGIDVPWPTPGLVLLGANLAIAIPSTPGQLGALELGVVSSLAIVGVPVSDALAFALVYHFMQLVPIVLVGATGFHLVAEGRADLPPVEATS